jgi:hypothetical protein
VDPLLLYLPAEVFTPGANLAHWQRCPGVGNLVMSTPISAMMTAAATGPMPGISSSRTASGAKGGQVRLDLGVQGGDVGVDPVDRASILASRNRWWSSKCLVKASRTAGSCPHPAPGHVRENRGVAFPGDQSSHRLPAGDPEDRMSLATTDSLIGVLQRFLNPLLLRGPGPNQVHPVPGQIPQLAQRPGWHEAGPQHLPFGDLAQPDRVPSCRQI